MKVKNLLTVVCLTLMASTAFASTKQDSTRQSSKSSLVKRVGNGTKNTVSKVGNGVKNNASKVRNAVTPVPASLLSACNQAASLKVEAFQTDYPELASSTDTAAMTKSASSKCSLDAKKQLNGQPVSGTSLFNIEDTTFSDAIEGVQSSKTTNKSCNSAELIRLRTENAALKRQISQVSSDSVDEKEVPEPRVKRTRIAAPAKTPSKTRVTPTATPVEEEVPASTPEVAPSPSTNNFAF